MDREKFIILILLYIAFIALGLPDQLLGIIIQRIGLNFLPVITTCFVIILLSIELRLRNLKA